MVSRSHSPVLRYASATVSIAVATVLRILFNSVLGDQFPFATLLFAVLLTAWYGGFGPALLAVVLGAFSSIYLLLPPRGSFVLTGLDQQMGMVLYISTSLGIALLGGAMRASQKRAERAKEAEQTQREQLRITLESIGDAVISTDAHGVVTFLNPVAQQLVGWVPNEAINRPLAEVFQIVNETTRQPVENPALRALRDGKIVGLANHTILISKDGTERPIDDSAAPIRNEQGDIYGSVLVFRDISERKQQEELLLEQREWLRVTLASIGDAVIATDTEGRVTFLNPIAEELTGWPQEEAEGQPLAAVFPIYNEQTQEAVENPVEKVLREGVMVGLANHTILIAKDGTARPIDDSAAPIRDGLGKMLGVILIFRDVTEHRRAEQELRASEALKSAILDASLDCIITMDHDGNVVEFNPAAEKTFGYRREQVIGKPLADFIIPLSLRGRHQNGMAHYLATGDGTALGKRLDLPALRADGTEFPVEVAITRIPTDGPPLFTAYLRDMSELKRVEQHRNVRIAITNALSEAGSPKGGADGLLQAVCENLDWDVGFYWAVDDSSTKLRYVAGWHRSDLTVAEFDAASCHHSFDKGEGLPGSVWSTGKSLWLLDMVTETQFPRAAAAAKQNLHSAFACPVTVDDKTHGVIEFFTERIQEPDADLLELMGTVAGNFGQFLERKGAEDELRRSEQELADFFENATVGLHWVGADGTILRANRAELELLGYSGEEYVGRPITDFHADEEVICDILNRLQAGEELHDYPARLRCKDGSIKDVLIDSSVMFRDGGFVHTRCFTRDVSERRKGEAALANQKRVLELLVQGAPLPDVLDALCEVIEGQAQDKLLATVLLLDEGGERLRSVAGRRAPAEYAQAVDGVEIGPCVGSCGTAAFRGEPVVVTDIAADPLWASFRELALSHGLRACWSTPILSSHSKVLGTFAVYYRTPRGPTEGERRLVDVLTSMASVAIERRRDETALRESEEKLRLLADTIPQLAWMARPDGYIFWYNRRWYEYTGKPPTDMEGDGWQSVHDPDMLPKVLERWKWSIASGQPFDMVFPIRGADGQFRPFLTRVNPLTNEDGQIQYWFGTNTDITELRQAREALAVSEERLRLALEAGRMGVWDWNTRTGDLKWSDSLEPLHGLAPGSFGGTFDHFQQLIHPQDRETVNAAIRQALETGGEFYVEFRNVWQNGGVHWIAGSGKVFPGDDGQPLRMIGIGLDVTQRKRAEQTARFLAEASAALAVLVDFDSTLHKVSSLAVPSFADWATVDLAEADGSLRRVSVSHIDPAKVQLAHEVHRRFPPDPTAPQGVWNILRTGRSEIVPEITDDLLVQSVKDDELLGIMRELGLKSYIGVPLTVRGKTLGVITFINAESGHRYELADLTVAEDLANRAAIAIENAQLYRELRDADRRKDDFLATLAHELRNPLAPIRNGLQVMRLSGSENIVIAEVRSMMERQLNQMIRLVDDLLDVSRITRDKLYLKKQPVELAAVVRSAVETSRPLIEQAEHTISVTLPPTPIYLDADLTRLAQVFLNLLNNSAKYTQPGGRIWLVAECFENEVAVKVRDNGLGIPAEALPRIFQMFSQVDRNMEMAQGGLGIGLTLVRRLVEMHGGTVEAHSDGPGQGSEFTVRLPVLKTAQVVAQSPTIADGLTAKRRILIVDDNQDSAISLGMMLKLMGNETHTVHDGLAAVESAEQFRPDMILLDIGLPKLNGYEACRRIREQAWSGGMEIVALTGWGGEDDRRRAKEAGFDHHLVKPVELAALDQLLAAPEPQSSSLQQTNPNLASLRVLVVDDRRDATHMLRTLLTTIGHDVQTAADGPSALALALDFRPEVVLLDINMPGMSGLEVAKRIRQQSILKGIVLIAMTGHGDDEDRQRSIESGFDFHLVKPADIKIVYEILATVKKK